MKKNEIDYSIDWDNYMPAIITGPATQEELEEAMKKLLAALQSNVGTEFAGGAAIELREAVAEKLKSNLILKDTKEISIALVDMYEETSFDPEANYYVKTLIIGKDKRIFNKILDKTVD